MQIQTTIVTTETQNVFGQDFEITTYSQTVKAYCDCCENQAESNRQTLENQGWFLGEKAQFCPECNY